MDRKDSTEAGEARRANHLRAVPVGVDVVQPVPHVGAAAPTTIGRLIARTALIADGALNRDRERDRRPAPVGERTGRRFSWFS